MRNLEFSPNGFKDFSWWIQTDRKMTTRLLRLFEEIQRSPFEGIGKPEALKHDFQGAWSRCLDDTHRIVYEVYDEKIRVLSCRYHYD